MRLSDIPLDRPVATLMVLLCVTVLGTVSVFYLPLGFMPVVKEPEVDIEVPFPGSHPLEVQRQVITPIEEELATIPGIKRIFGSANNGQASMEAMFEWTVDIELKKMEVREAVERARPQLPAGIGHIRVEGDTDGGSGEVLGGRISAEQDLSESWALLDRRIRRPLERIAGVARVDLYGVEPQQVRIDIDLDALKQHGIQVSTVVQLVNAANLDLDLGAVRNNLLRYDVRTTSKFRDIDSVRNLALDGAGLRLHDVAKVSLREPELEYGRHLNRNFAIGFDVFKEPTANTVDTVDRLLDRIDLMATDPELKGIRILVWANQGEEILASLVGLRNAGLFGGFLAIFVLYFFLRRISTTLIVAVAIPFSILVTCGAMFLFGKEFNVLTMLGLMLGVGMLVDNAVVVIENIYRLQGQGLDPAAAARIGTRQVVLAVLAATATTIIVWSWLFVSEPNTMTILIGEVALVICLSVACSLLISLTFIPLAAARFIPKKQLSQGFLITHFVPWYRNVLNWTLGHRAIALGCLFTLAFSAAIPVYFIEKAGDPQQQQRDVPIQYEIHDSSTKETIEGYVDQVEVWLESRKEELGYEDIYSYYQQPQFASTRVYLPRSGMTNADYEDLKEQLQVGLPVIPGVKLEIGDQRGRHRGPRSGGYVSVAIRGDDPEYLEPQAAAVEQRFRELDDVIEVYGPSLSGAKEIRVLIDPDRARSLGLSPRVVADAVGFVFRGQQLRRYHGKTGEIEILLGLPEMERPGLSALRTLPLPLPNGETIALGTVTDIDITRTASHIQRLDRKTNSRVTVQFDEDETTTKEIRAAMQPIMDDLQLPDGYTWDWGSEMHDEDDALAFMLKGILFSLLLVLLLMAALFESFTQPLAILITLPLALFGAFWALWLLGFVFEVIAFIGVIILIGIVVNNGIVMVDHVNNLRREGLSRRDALIMGCGDRLRPVLMTVITTVVGLIPLGMSQFTVAGVYIQSMAVAMIGGLISSSIFTLLGLPVWYCAVEDFGAVLAGLLPQSIQTRLNFPVGGVLVRRDDR
jgi:HAE1 family hydrophobic/amphiphilic exporter-1